MQEIILRGQLCKQFLELAERLRRKPTSLLTEAVRDFLEQQEDEEMRRIARRNARRQGIRIQDLDRIIKEGRQHRRQQELRTNGAAKTADAGRD